MTRAGDLPAAAPTDPLGGTARAAPPRPPDSAAAIRAEAIAAAKRRAVSSAAVLPADAAARGGSIESAKRRLTGDRPVDAALWRPRGLAESLVVVADARGATLRPDGGGSAVHFRDDCPRVRGGGATYAAGGADLPASPTVLLDVAYPEGDWGAAAIAKRLRSAEDRTLAVDGGPSLARSSFNEARVDASAYAAYAEADGDGDDAPLYVFDASAVGRLGLDVGAPPPCFGDDASADLLGSDDSSRRPLPSAWLLVGAARSGTPIHDHPLTVAWNQLLSGAKVWVALPPDVGEGALDPSGGGTLDLSAAEWFLSWANGSASLPEGAVTISQRPGETVFVPAGWWHAVLNAATSTAVSRSLALRRDFSFLGRPRRTWSRVEADRSSALDAARARRGFLVGGDLADEDVRGAAALLAETWPRIAAGAREATLRASLQEGSDALPRSFVLRDGDGAIVAHSRLRAAGLGCALASVAVAEPLRRRGLGARVVALAEAAAAAAGYRRLSLSTTIPAFYRRLGYDESPPPPGEAAGAAAALEAALLRRSGEVRMTRDLGS